MGFQGRMPFILTGGNIRILIVALFKQPLGVYLGTLDKQLFLIPYLSVPHHDTFTRVLDAGSCLEREHLSTYLRHPRNPKTYCVHLT